MEWQAINTLYILPAKIISNTIDFKTFQFAKKVQKHLDRFTSKQDDHFVMIEQEVVEMLCNYEINFCLLILSSVLNIL